MPGDIETPAEFAPLHIATRFRRALVFVVGPLLWLAAVLLVGFVVHRGDVVELGLAVALVGFFVSLLVSVTARWLRRREERRAVAGS